MSGDCENLPTCGFFKKYFKVNQTACRTFIKDYCRGETRNVCERKAYRKLNGAPPSDDMMPNGVMLPKLTS
jgi:hypothetical protein